MTARSNKDSIIFVYMQLFRMIWTQMTQLNLQHNDARIIQWLSALFICVGFPSEAWVQQQ